MNTKIHVILETLLDFFGKGRKILNDWKGVHMEVRGFSSSYIKNKKNNNTKEGKFKKGNKRINLRARDFDVIF